MYFDYSSTGSTALTTSPLTAGAQYKQSLKFSLYSNYKQKGQLSILVLAGVLVIVAIVTGAYYLGRSTTPKPVPSPVATSPASTQRGEQTLQSTPAPSPTSDETTNWKTYRNTSLGFQFKYPSNGVVMNESPSVVYISYQENTKPYWTFTVNLSDNPSHLTTKQVVDKIITDIRNNKNAPSAKSQADQMQQSMKDYTNGQINGVKLQSFDEGYPQSFGRVVQATGNKIYEFNIGNGSGGGVSDEDEKLLNKILSTFRFD